MGGRVPGLCACTGPSAPAPGQLCGAGCRAEWPRLAGAFAAETAGVSAVLALSSVFLFLPRLFLSSSVFLFELGLRAASRPGCRLYHRQPSCRWCMSGRQAVPPSGRCLAAPSRRGLRAAVRSLLPFQRAGALGNVLMGSVCHVFLRRGILVPLGAWSLFSKHQVTFQERDQEQVALPA